MDVPPLPHNLDSPLMVNPTKEVHKKGLTLSSDTKIAHPSINYAARYRSCYNEGTRRSSIHREYCIYTKLSLIFLYFDYTS
jgi:hypothetical protein